MYFNYKNRIRKVYTTKTKKDTRTLRGTVDEEEIFFYFIYFFFENLEDSDFSSSPVATQTVFRNVTYYASQCFF